LILQPSPMPGNSSSSLPKAVLAMLVFTAAALGACTNKPLQVFGDRLFVEARVNDQQVTALLDSAAEMSFMDRTWAEENGIAFAGAETAKGSGGEEQVVFAKGVTVKALGVRLEDLTVAVLDLADLSTRLIGRPTHFILGRELFDRERLAIDIEDGTIAVAARDFKPAGVTLALSSERGLEAFGVAVNDVPVQADFDLGNGSEILIGRDFAAKLGLLADPASLPTRKGGGVGGEIEHKIVHLARLEIAGVKFDDVEAAVDETDSAGDLNIGVRVLKNFRITVDFSEHMLWLDPR